MCAGRARSRIEFSGGRFYRGDSQECSSARLMRQRARETQIVCVPRRIILFECHCCFYTSSFIVAAVTTFGKEQRAALSSCHLTNNASRYIENPVAESVSGPFRELDFPAGHNVCFPFVLVVGLDATFIFLVLDI